MKDRKKRPITITFKTRIERQGETEEYEFNARGELYHRGSQDYLRFEEGVSESEKVQTTIKWDGRELILIRQGAILMRQAFITGIETSGRYVTPQASWETKANTERVLVQWPQGKRRGVLHLRYHFTLQGQDTGVHEVRLTLEEDIRS
ncbi:DUF1934 domain-containing protein [Halalkalibacterium ligniniphilum]|uniref:DUF1934 domain-containing protein n=1 Tax=Halalkalibacterium ligniniphilum TaxID=1134413 RepID=UPI00034BCD70|nr:DUF1934 family protein [Halalkalibacterium ligniniphilum]